MAEGVGSIDAGTDPDYRKINQVENKKGFNNDGKGPINSKKPKLEEKETGLINAGTDPINDKKGKRISKEGKYVLPGEDDPNAPGEVIGGARRKPRNRWLYNRQDSDEPIVAVKSKKEKITDPMGEENAQLIRQLQEDDKKERYRQKKIKYISPEDLAVYEEGDRIVAEYLGHDRPSKKVSLEVTEISDFPIEWNTMKRQLEKKGQSKRGSVYAVDAETSLLISEYAAEEQAERGHRGRKGSEVDPETARLLRKFGAEELKAARQHRKSSLDPETAVLLQMIPEDKQERNKKGRKKRKMDPEVTRLIAEIDSKNLADPRYGPGHDSSETCCQYMKDVFGRRRRGPRDR